MAKIKIIKIFNSCLQKDKYFRELVILEAWAKSHNFTFTNLLSKFVIFLKEMKHGWEQAIKTKMQNQAIYKVMLSLIFDF